MRELSGIERHEAGQLLKQLELSEQWIRELEQKMKEEAAGDERIERLRSIPGVGPKTAFAFVAHVAEERFGNAGQVSNYLGLVPRVYISGETVRYGRITKRGNGYVRALRLVIGVVKEWRKVERAIQIYDVGEQEESDSSDSAPSCGADVYTAKRWDDT